MGAGGSVAGASAPRAAGEDAAGWRAAALCEASVSTEPVRSEVKIVHIYDKEEMKLNAEARRSSMTVNEHGSVKPRGSLWAAMDARTDAHTGMLSVMHEEGNETCDDREGPVPRSVDKGAKVCEGSKVTFARLVRTQQCALHIGISHPADVSHFNEIDVHGIQIDSHGIGVGCRRIPKLG